MKKLLLATLLSTAFTAHALDGIPGEGLTPKTVTGLVSPESVVQAKDGNIYVTEIGEFGKDGDGQISKLDKKGNVTVFAKGMDDPKGIAAIGDKLYVADKNRVLEINKDGTWQVYGAQMAFPGTPVFLNDIEADKQGNLYVSDSGTLKAGGQIYKIAKGGGAITVVVDSKNPACLAPNGLLFVGLNTLLSVDFESGILYRVNIATGEMSKMAEGFLGGDGIAKTKAGKVLISSWKEGNIYQLVTGKSRVIKSGYQAAADIALTNDGKYLMVPDMKKGELSFLPM